MNKKMINKISLCVLLSCLVCHVSCVVSHAAFKDSGWGTRAAGMGGAFTAISDDSSAPLWNAAGIGQIDRYEANFMYARLFTGLDLYAGEDKVDLGLNYGSFVIPTSRGGNFGISWASFDTENIYKEDTFTISYARKINEFMPRLIPEILLGLNLKYLYHGYTLDERTVDDPVFAQGDSKGVFTGDIGLLIKAVGEERRLSVGLMAKNINEPDVGLKTEDKVPLEGRIGLAYRMGSYRVLNFLTIEDSSPSVDVSYRDKDLNVHIGWESWFGERTWGFRVGGNDREISSGISFNTEKLGRFGLQFDYAFIWPLEIDETTGSHRTSLTVRFGESSKELEEARRLEAEEEHKIKTLEALAEKRRLEAERAKREAFAAKREAGKANKLVREKDDVVKDLLNSIQKSRLQMKEDERGVIITVKAHFSSGKAAINKLDKPAMDQVVEILKRYAKYKVRIEGHTDSVGKSESNLKLSEMRAKSVYDYLVGSGISSGRLSSLGFGETAPIASNTTVTGRAENRRVEFIILTAQ